MRSLVQQDMMRPKSALYYTKEMEEISQEVADIIERDMDSDNCYEINSICQKYALETVAYIFLGSKLGTLAGEGDGTRMVEIQVICMYLPLPHQFLMVLFRTSPGPWHRR